MNLKKSFDMYRIWLAPRHIFNVPTLLVTCTTVCGWQNMHWLYLKIWKWEWIFGYSVKAISSPGVRSPWTTWSPIKIFYFSFLITQKLSRLCTGTSEDLKIWWSGSIKGRGNSKANCWIFICSNNERNFFFFPLLEEIIWRFDNLLFIFLDLYKRVCFYTAAKI